MFSPYVIKGEGCRLHKELKKEKGKKETEPEKKPPIPIKPSFLCSFLGECHDEGIPRKNTS
jgi:hypothetical protein